MGLLAGIVSLIPIMEISWQSNIVEFFSGIQWNSHKVVTQFWESKIYFSSFWCFQLRVSCMAVFMKWNSLSLDFLVSWLFNFWIFLEFFIKISFAIIGLLVDAFSDCCRRSTTYSFHRVSDHSFSTHAKFSKKVTFLNPWYANLCYQGTFCVSSGKRC